MFIYPGFDTVVDIRALHNRLAAKACQIARELSDGSTKPCCQPHTKWIEDSSHGINNGDARRREQYRRIGEQRDQKDAGISKPGELLHPVTDAIDVKRDSDDSK